MTTRSWRYLSLLLAIGTGVLLGWAANGPLKFLNWTAMFVWGVAAVGLALFRDSLGATIVRLAIYGEVLGFAFMCFGYSGVAPLISRVGAFAVIALVSAACATVIGVLTHVIRRRVLRHRVAPTQT